MKIKKRLKMKEIQKLFKYTKENGVFIIKRKII